MASVYISEPVTRGKVILKTSAGDVDIELWPKEAPKACRNFVQLCMEGYYDNTIFHRVIPGFMIQGGDPTGTGKGGESVYGEPFADEVHSRIRFNHRGQVAMASNGANTNGSQFFITLDKCDWLDRKHTIFGKITGNTIFNVLKMGELEADKDDRPLFPPRIISTEVLMSPFDDIVCRATVARPAPADRESQLPSRPAAKATKNKSLLSFEDDGRDEEEDESSGSRPKGGAAGASSKPVKKGIVSSHDVLDDPRLLKESAPIVPSAAAAEKRAAQEESERKAAMRNAVASAKSKADQGARPSKTSDDSDHDSADNGKDDTPEAFDRAMRARVLHAKQKLAPDARPSSKSHPESDSRGPKGSASPPRKKNRPRDSDDDDDDDSDSDASSRGQPSKGKAKGALNFKRSSGGGGGAASGRADANDYVSPLEMQRQKLKQRRVQRSADRQAATLERLNAFKTNLTTTKPEGDAEGVDAAEDWKSHQLHFVKDKLANVGNADDDQYAVVDPRAQSQGRAPTKHDRHLERISGQKKVDRW